MLKRFSKPIAREAAEPSASFNEVLNFEDFSNVRSVAWVGEHGNSLDIEIRTHDGKETLVDSVPTEYLKLGQNREELELNAVLSNNSVRIVTSFEGGADVKGTLVFTCEK